MKESTLCPSSALPLSYSPSMTHIHYIHSLIPTASSHFVATVCVCFLWSCPAPHNFKIAILSIRYGSTSRKWRVKTYLETWEACSVSSVLQSKWLNHLPTWTRSAQAVWDVFDRFVGGGRKKDTLYPPLHAITAYSEKSKEQVVIELGGRLLIHPHLSLTAWTAPSPSAHSAWFWA